MFRVPHKVSSRYSRMMIIVVLWSHSVATALYFYETGDTHITAKRENVESRRNWKNFQLQREISNITN